LLSECVLAYSPMDAAQKEDFNKILDQESHKEIRAMHKTWYEEDIEQSEKEGERKGRIAILTEMLEAKFGTVPEAVRDHLQKADLPELHRIGVALLRANALTELGLGE